MQTEQCEPSVSPVFVQVGATASSVTKVCPNAGISFCAVKISPQIEHFVPSVKPFSVHVAGLPKSLILNVNVASLIVFSVNTSQDIAAAESMLSDPSANPAADI